MGGHRTPTRYPGAIKVGDRVRKDLGDIPDFAGRIERDGLLQPIVVTPENELLCGQRRLAAWRHLGRWDSPIPVHVVDIDAIARGEWAENTDRKNLTPSESVELMHRLRPAAEAHAAERRRELGRRHGEDPVAQFPTRGRARDLVARYVGRSARSLEKAAEVVSAAAAEPERFGPLQTAMDRTGKVHGPYRRLVVMRQAAELRAEPPPLPSRGPYRVIVADPPWPFDGDAIDPSERGTHPYPQMSYAAIRALGVRAIAAEDAVLWLWVTNHHLPEAFAVLAAWGFNHRTMLTWRKDVMGRGQYLREQTEHCLLAVRGRPVLQAGSETTILEAPRRLHSEKPDVFYDLVERLCPASGYAELFPHHRRRPGWDTFREDGGGAFTDADPPLDPTVADLCPIGAIVRTCNGQGPFVVTGVIPWFDRAGPAWAVQVARPGRPAKPWAAQALRPVAVVGGRVRHLRAGWEVIVEHAAAADLAEATA